MSPNNIDFYKDLIKIIYQLLLKISSDTHLISSSDTVVQIAKALRDHLNRSSGFPTRYNINQAVQSQKMPRGLKFRI